MIEAKNDYVYIFWHQNLVSSESQQILFAMIYPGALMGQCVLKDSFIKC